MASKLFRKALSEVKPETKIFVKKYLDLLERIHELMVEKKMSQKDLAAALEQQPSAVSRLLNSEDNYMSLRTVAKIEAILKEDILMVKGRESMHHLAFSMEKKKQIVPMQIVHINTERNKTMKQQDFKFGKIAPQELQMGRAI
jgi:transcriptional regulator with XRE-family HTH domain